MDILLVSATEKEAEALKKHLRPGTGLADNLERFSYKNHSVDILITGAGMLQTAWHMGKVLAKNGYTLAINSGIAGSFTEKIKTGDVVQVTEDILAELGAEDGARFLPVEELAIPAKSRFCATGAVPNAILDSLPEAKGITVNRVHGDEESIRAIKQRLQPDIESMEGAAFFYACEMAGLHCIQLRAISNKIEKRNRESWNIPLAIQNLNRKLISILDTL